MMRPTLDARARLLQAMANRQGANRQGGNPKDRRYASLAALPTWAETRTSDGQTGGGGPNSFTAFQPDAFQNDAFQVE